jgi:hypothetical protein
VVAAQVTDCTGPTVWGYCTTGHAERSSARHSLLIAQVGYYRKNSEEKCSGWWTSVPPPLLDNRKTGRSASDVIQALVRVLIRR